VATKCVSHFLACKSGRGFASNIRDVPYEVTDIEKTADTAIFRLKRITDDQWRDVSEFFRDLIERNAGRIAPELSDAIAAANSRLFASLAAESAATVPFFIQKDAATNDRIVKSALPRAPSSFAEFFEVAPGEYDFSPLAVPQRLTKLTSNLRKNGTSELTLYMYKRRLPGQPRFVIYSASDFGFENEAQRSEFIREALENDYAFVKAIAGPVIRPKATEENAAFEALMDLSPHHAAKLKAQFDRIVAIGDIVDISRQVMEREGLQDPEAQSSDGEQ
jgi:hypothetical protein